MLILKANKPNGIKIFEKAMANNQPVIFPTDTIYGIGTFISNIKANEKIYEIKGRPKNKPFPILISNIKQLNNLIEGKLSNKQNELINKYWPGSTLIFKANPKVSSFFVYNNTIAIRYIERNWLSDVISHFNIPLSATSANLSGKEYKNNISQIINDFASSISFYIIDKLSNKKPSSIIDISTDEIKIIRN